MQTLAEILKRRSGSALPLDRMVELNRLRGHWVEMVGELLADKSFPYSIKQGKLSVIAEESVWLNELYMLKSELLKKVRQWVPSIKEVQVRLAPLPQLAPQPAKPQYAPQPRRVNFSMVARDQSAGRPMPEWLRAIVDRLAEKQLAKKNNQTE